MIPIGEAGVATERRKLTLRVEHDQDTENPATSCDGQWTIYSFSRKHTNYKDPEECGLALEVVDGMPVVKNPGLRRKMAVGLAFVLSYYEHSGCVWSIKGKGPQCRWDTTSIAGLLVWENKPADMGAKSYEDRQKDAEQFLETYTAWCNGQCYWYDLKDEDDNTVDSCGGFIGPDLGYMFDAIREAVGDDEINFETSDAGSARDLREEYETAAKKAAERAQSGKS